MKFKNIVGFLFLTITQSVISQSYTLDTGFGINGKVILNTSYNAEAKAVLIQPDNKIVFSSYDLTNSGNYLANINILLRRYNQDGSVDVSFGLNGEARATFAQGFNYPTGKMVLKIDSNGKIYCYGGQGGGTNGGLLNGLARFNSNGSLDTTFGSGGVIMYIAKDTSGDFLPNGKVIVASTVGDYSSTTKSDFGVTVYNAGSNVKDATFGTNGFVQVNIGNTTTTPSTQINLTSRDYLTCAKIQSDGKILLGGYTDANGPYEGENFVIVRLNIDGSLDSTFGNQGIVISDYGLKERIKDLVVANDGKIIVVGTKQYNYEYASYLVSKYNSDGSQDTSFGTNGVLSSVGVETANSVILLNDNKILIGGSSYYGGNQTIFYNLIKINSNGTLDNSFGVNGVINDYYGPVGNYTTCLAANDNFIITAGSKYSPYSIPAMAKYILGNYVPLNDSNFEKNNILIYPNPFVNEINLDFDLENLKFELYDCNGRNIKNLVYNSQGGEGRLKLKFSNEIAKGIYYLIVFNDETLKSFKIIKE